MKKRIFENLVQKNYKQILHHILQMYPEEFFVHFVNHDEIRVEFVDALIFPQMNRCIVQLEFFLDKKIKRAKRIALFQICYPNCKSFDDFFTNGEFEELKMGDVKIYYLGYDNNGQRGRAVLKKLCNFKMEKMEYDENMIVNENLFIDFVSDYVIPFFHEISVRKNEK